MFLFKNHIKKLYLKLFGKYRLTALINKEIQDNWTILDAGCGRSSSLKDIKKGSYKIGLDIYEPYIIESKKQSIHNDYVIGDVRKLPFKSDSFDCAVSIDVLEHLNKEDGLEMIKEMKRVAKRKIILTTPNGFLPTYAGPKDNPEERHLSGWTYDELKKLGFKVCGLNGLKMFWIVRHGRAIVRGGLPVFSSLTVDISEFFAYYYPSLAFQFFFVKNLNNKNKLSNGKNN